MISSSENLLPLGDFLPADKWQTHVNSIFYGTLGSGIHRHFQTYVSRDHRLAFCLAEEFFEKFSGRDFSGTCFILEWGVGNGNLAACFLDRLKALDLEGQVYSRIRYVLCDYSREILNAAYCRLKEHVGQFSAIQVDAEGAACFKAQSICKILSNEIWDDLAAKVVLKDDGLFYEEYLRPTLDLNAGDIDLQNFPRAFAEKNLDELQNAPLEKINWERAWQRVNICDWPFAEMVEAHCEKLEEKIPLPVNIGALTSLQKACVLLSPKGLGYTGLDYGMLSFEDINHPEKPWFNLYGGQYTAMVNFPLLAKVAKNIGFSSAAIEYQHRYVGRRLNEQVAGVVELVQCHPQAEQMEPWDRDILMLGTLHALNGVYQSPYKNFLDYSPSPGTPKKQRKKIGRLVESLNPRGVPDTVAYVTRNEVFSTLKPLRKLGYREKDLHQAFSQFQQPVSFIYADFQK